MINCPNCGAAIEPYKCKCEYCGTWYFDFTAFDVSKDVPYYVKFRTSYGVITALAKPELKTIEMQVDGTYDCDWIGDNCVIKPVVSKKCDLNVTFHSLINPEDRSFYRLEIADEKED